MSTIHIRNIREHNLRGFDLDLPRGAWIVCTGVSGSGKSSLAFDTVYREARRLYLESFSSHARQFLGKLDRADVESITHLPPALSVDQHARSGNIRSTVGTLTELYDHLRLLFARIGRAQDHPSGPKLLARLFSFNTPHGACPHCQGVGLADRIDPQLIVADPDKTLRGGALVPTNPNGYIMYSQVTIDVLNQVCQAHGFDVDTPWRNLSEEHRRVIFHGSERIKVPFGKHPLENRLKWSGITAKPREEGFYKGLIPTMEGILKRDRNKNILRFARSVTCPSCSGSRLRPEALQVTINEQNIAQFSALSLRELQTTLNTLPLDQHTSAVAKPILVEMNSRFNILSELGLAYLTLDRGAPTLSGGESQRLRLAMIAASPLSGVLYVLDEAAIGLHQQDKDRLLTVVQRLRYRGNTILAVEHDPHAILRADHLIDIGPLAGAHGGQLLYSGPPAQLIQYPEKFPISMTAQYLAGKEVVYSPSARRPGSGRFSVIGAAHHNLKRIDAHFQLNAFNAVTGVSGSGKSTLVDHILAKALRQRLHRAQTEPGQHQSIEGAEVLGKVIHIDQSPIGRTPRSNPATYTGVSDHIRDLFAAQLRAKELGLKKGHFSFNVKGGRCEDCGGSGKTVIGMHGLGDLEHICETCDGQRFLHNTLQVKWRDHHILDVLNLTVDRALSVFHGQSKIIRHLSALQKTGLGYLSLGQSATTLSGGEAQRVKLAAELARPGSGHTLYILDEPTTGLHLLDVNTLLNTLHDLVNVGHTVIVVEHHPQVIKSADHIIDLGPGAGPDGGAILAQGPPETIANSGSPTGNVLKNILNKQVQIPASAHKAQSQLPISLQGVNTHNLRDLNVTFPAQKLTIITGPSGSGKTSLAHHSLFAQASHHFLQNLSTYARRMLRGAISGDVQNSSGLTPAIAITRRGRRHNPRSTVGVATGIYDHLRLLFSRTGDSPQKLSARHFSFNHQQGACPQCNGLGTITSTDPEKIITHPERSILDGAMDGSKPGQFYGDPHGQYLAILQTAASHLAIDLTPPWRDLDQKSQNFVMHGAGGQTFDVTWRYKRDQRTGEHQMQSTWPGFLHYFDDEYNRKKDQKRGQIFRDLLSQSTCPQCQGSRLNETARKVRIGKTTIVQLTTRPIWDLLPALQQLKQEQPRSKAVIDLISARLKPRIIHLQNLGIGYLSLDRATQTLSGGEFMRVRIASQLGGALSGLTYILDEPTLGLHPRDAANLVKVLRQLLAQQNTLVIIEHDPELIRVADHIIDMGPGAGRHGGQIVAQGSLSEILNNPNSPTGKALASPTQAASRNRPMDGQPIKITNAHKHHLKHFDLEIPTGGIVVFTGVSGSGKSTLLFDLIQASYQNKPVGCDHIQFPPFPKLIAADQQNPTRTSHSSPATLLDILDPIRTLFAKTAAAKEASLRKSHFTFKTGGCKTCNGQGTIKTTLDFLPDVEVPCEACQGQRFQEHVLAVKYKDRNLNQILDMEITTAIDLFEDTPAIHRPLGLMEEMGLGYLTLGQKAHSLSGGESQRLKLAAELLTYTSDNTSLFLFDEPTTGLHFKDIERLITLFQKLADQGHTLLIAEHHQKIIQSADWIIDMGPEGGAQGGQIIYQGRLEDLRNCQVSHTAKYL